MNYKHIEEISEFFQLALQDWGGNLSESVVNDWDFSICIGDENEIAVAIKFPEQIINYLIWLSESGDVKLQMHEHDEDGSKLTYSNFWQATAFAAMVQ